MNKLLMGGAIAVIALGMIGATTMGAVQSSYGTEISKRIPVALVKPAVITTSDENVYVVWGSNDTATNNTEVMFRVSEDGGQSYGDKVNLSNSSGADSTDFDIEATGDDVIVSWWETNQTSAEPVIIVSTDNGATFSPILKLATNGTIGEAETEEEG